MNAGETHWFSSNMDAGGLIFRSGGGTGLGGWWPRPELDPGGPGGPGGGPRPGFGGRLKPPPPGGTGRRGGCGYG